MEADWRRAISSSFGCRHVPVGGVGAAGGITAGESGCLGVVRVPEAADFTRAVDDIMRVRKMLARGKSCGLVRLSKVSMAVTAYCWRCCLLLPFVGVVAHPRSPQGRKNRGRAQPYASASNPILQISFRRSSLPFFLISEVYSRAGHPLHTFEVAANLCPPWQ